MKPRRGRAVGGGMDVLAAVRVPVAQLSWSSWGRALGCVLAGMVVLAIGRAARLPVLPPLPEVAAGAEDDPAGPRGARGRPARRRAVRRALPARVGGRGTSTRRSSIGSASACSGTRRRWGWCRAPARPSAATASRSRPRSSTRWWPAPADRGGIVGGRGYRARMPFAWLALLVGCGERPCEAGCASDEVCWWAEERCVPAPIGEDCPDDYVYSECGTGSCPGCRDCVAVCLPEDHVGTE